MRQEDVQEPLLSRNHAKNVADMLERHWSLGPDEYPHIFYAPYKLSVDAKKGYIYVQNGRTTRKVSSIDYQSVDLRSTVTVKVTTFDPERMYRWVGEVNRILMGHRRSGLAGVHHYSEILVLDEEEEPDLINLYTHRLTVSLVSYHVPVHTAGFEGGVNKEGDR